MNLQLLKQPYEGEKPSFIAFKTFLALNSKQLVYLSKRQSKYTILKFFEQLKDKYL